MQRARGEGGYIPFGRVGFGKGGEVGWDGFVDVDAVRGQSRDWILGFGESWDELGLCCCEQVDVCT